MKGLIGVALVAGLAVYVQAHGAQKHEEAAAPQKAAGDMVTMEGEVLDLACYLGEGEKGKEHQKCAKDCLVKKGVAPGLLTADGKVFVLVADHKHEKAFAPVLKLAAEHVKVTGRKTDTGGLQAILVQSVEQH